MYLKVPQVSIQTRIIYIHSYKPIIIKKLEHFFPRSKIETIPAFWNKQISSPHHYETHFYTILKI